MISTVYHRVHRRGSSSGKTDAISLSLGRASHRELRARRHVVGLLDGWLIFDAFVVKSVASKDRPKIAVASTIKYYHSLPPISKAYGTICLGVTAASALGLLSPYWIALDYTSVFYSLQVWRVVTNFFFLRPFSFNLLSDS